MFINEQHKQKFIDQLKEGECKANRLAYLYIVSTLDIDPKIINSYTKQIEGDERKLQLHEFALNLLGEKEGNVDIKQLTTLNTVDLKLILDAITIAAEKVSFLISPDFTDIAIYKYI